MKNFFKKLAFVLALAMVLVSVAPATANAAAKAPSLKKTSKILYIGGDITGTISDSYRFYFNNAKGYTATWESLNEDVVVIEGKTVVAVGVGKAVVRATLTNKAGNEVVREATVWVKQNAEKVGFGSTKAIESPIPVGEKVKVNVFRQVGDVKVWTQSDVKTCTDSIVWTSSDEKVATVDKWGTVKAVGAGEATITATATQSQGPTAGESASYKVTVVAGMTAVKQITSSKVEITFGAPVADDVLKTMTMKTAAGVDQTSYIKKTTVNADKTVVTVETYVPFVDKTVYTFAIDSLKTSIDMAATIGDIAEVRIVSPVLVADNETADIKVKFYNANGVELEGVGDINRATFTLVDSPIHAFVYSNQLTIFEKDKTVVVKGEYSTGKYDANYNEIKLPIAPFAVACVDSLDATINAISDTVVTTKATVGKDDFNGNMSLPAETSDRYLRVKVVLSDGKDSYTSTVKYESTDSTKLIVDPITGKLIPVVANASVGVIVTVGNVSKVVTVTIGAKEVASSIQPEKTALSLSNGKVQNSATITVKTLSNYNNEVAATNMKVEAVGDNKLETFTYVAGKPSTITVNAKDVKAGNYNLRVTVSDKVFILSINILDAQGKDVKVVKFVPGKTSIETTVTKESNITDYGFDIETIGYATNNAAISNEVPTDLEIRNKDGKVIFSVVAGKESVTHGAFSYVVGETAKVTVKTVYAADTLANADYKKLDAGTYTISGKTAKNTVVNAFFTITDNQKVPNYSVLESQIKVQTNDVASIALDVASKCFEVKDAAGTKLDVTVKFNSTITSTSKNGTYTISVTELSFVETLTENIKVKHVVKISRPITVVIDIAGNN